MLYEYIYVLNPTAFEVPNAARGTLRRARVHFAGGDRILVQPIGQTEDQCCHVQ